MNRKSRSIVYRQLILCLLSGITLLLQFSAASVRAQNQQQYFISPRLTLGLHTKASMESPIKQLITSGTAVEVIKTDKEFSQIKTQDGIKGWLKSRFLTQDEPAVRKVERLQQALQEALSNNKTLTDAAKVSIISDTSPTAEALLSAQEKQTYEETIALLQEELKAWEQLDAQDKQAQKIQLEKNNQQLKKRLSVIASLATGKEMTPNHFAVGTLVEATKIIDDSSHNIIALFKNNYLILMMVSGVSFLMGIFIMDVFNRKRHGGYRV